MESKFSVETIKRFCAWVVGVDHTPGAANASEGVADATSLSAGGILFFIAVSFFLIFSLTKHRSSSNDAIDIL